MALISTSKILVGFHGPAYGTPAASVAERNEWSGVMDGGSSLSDARWGRVFLDMLKKCRLFFPFLAFALHAST